MVLREENVCSPSSCQDPSRPSAPSPQPPAAGSLLSVARGASSAYRGWESLGGLAEEPSLPSVQSVAGSSHRSMELGKESYLWPVCSGFQENWDKRREE